MSDRDCMNCVRNTPDQGCTAWNCDYINRKEAIEAWKQIHKPKGTRYFVVSRCGPAEEFGSEAEAYRYISGLPEKVREYDGELQIVVTDADKTVLRTYEV